MSKTGEENVSVNSEDNEEHVEDLETTVVQGGGKDQHNSSLRRSVRETKKPDFLGAVSYGGRKKKVQQGPSKNLPKPATTSAASSQKTSSSQVLRMKAEAEANRLIRAIQDEFASEELKFKMLQQDVQDKQMEISKIEKAIADAETEQLETADLLKKREELHDAADQLASNLRRAELTLEVAQKKCERAIACHKDDLEVKIGELDLEDDVSANSADEDLRDLPEDNDVSVWANTTRQINKKGEAFEVPGVLETQPAQAKMPSDMSKLLARQTQGKDLPIFTGKPEEWLPFISTYENSSNNCGYGNADNLPRLLKSLKGDALKTVQCLLINPETVPEAIEELRMHYGNPRVLIESMIQRVRETPAVKNDLNNLKEFGSAVKNLVAMIMATKKSHYLHNPSLMTELEQKLSPHLRLDWGSTMGSTEPSLEDFSKWVGKHVKTLCQQIPVKSTAETKPEKKTFSRNKGEKTYSTHESKPSKEERPCSFCKKKGHRNNACPDLTRLTVEERSNFVMKSRACYGCLNMGHAFKDCRSKRTCGINGCDKKHHRVLHQDKKTPPSAEKTEEPESSTSSEVAKTATVANKATTDRVHFMMAPVLLKGPKGQVRGFAVMDSFSSMTSIEEETAKLLGVVGTPKILEVEGFGATTKYPDSRIVDLELVPEYDSLASFQLEGVRTVKKMNLPSQSLHQADLKKWKHLKGINFPTYHCQKPIIMIGDDNAALSDVLDARYVDNPNAPRAVLTPLGWVLRGKIRKGEGSASCFHVREASPDDTLHALVKQHFALESFNLEGSNKPRSSEDDRALAIMEKTMRRTVAGWECGLLWKDDDPVLPRSKGLALRRLKQMEGKMSRDPEFAKVYREKIQEYVEKGFARKLSPEEAEKESQKTFYVPHFMAPNPKKMKKYRFVFDAAARVEGKCLNDFLLRGPENLSSLLDILMKFRQRQIAISADIKDMYHRVRIREEDQCAQRFFFTSPTEGCPPDVYQMDVMIFGATCSPSIAQEVKNRNAKEFQEWFPNAVIPITELHYVDDYLNSHDTVQDAIKCQEEVREVHKRGGFTICNFLSNSPEVMQAIPEDLHSATMKSLELEECAMERVLGLFYSPKEDIFTFSLKFLKVQEDLLQGEKLPTKRELLALVMSIYDQLGLISHFTIKGKIMLQLCWRRGIGWDQVIPEEIARNWHQWREDLQKIPQFRIPRCYSPTFSSADRVELHVFVDGSEEAYGVTAFFRIMKGDAIDVAFVLSKARVAPIKNISINRMELQAAALGAKIRCYIVETIQIKIDEIYMHSDSTTVLYWIRADGRIFQQFVGHRIGLIQSLTEVSEWRWVPTHLNPADEITRINSPCDLSHTSVRIRGPEFLYLPQEEWPIEKIKMPKPHEETLEMRKQFVNVAIDKPNLIDIKRFSKWRILLRAMAFVFRVYQRPLPKRLQLSVEEVQKASDFLIKKVQEESYPEELALLKSGKTWREFPKSSRLHKVSVYLDENGILRAQGRLENAELPYQVKHPAILDKKHRITQLLVSHYHERCGHHGHERIANEVRQLYHIPSLRQAVRAAANHCRDCAHRRVQPNVPEMGQLPTKRELLALVMSIYDQLGLISHFTIKGKIMLQLCWRRGIGWDQVIPEEIARNWHQWREDLQKIPQFRIPRCYSPTFSSADRVELHVFVDGSEEAYGVTAFFRIMKGDAIDVAFVLSKARVAPIKNISINRMELQAAALGAKIRCYIVETIQIKIDEIYMHSDSTTVLYWIRADGRIFQQFVGHRIGLIQSLTEVSEWRWVPTHLNPADEITRINSPCDLSHTSVRIRGPEFLYLPQEEWPIEKIKMPKPHEETLEMRKQFVNVAIDKPNLIDIKRFSKWRILLRAMAFVFRVYQRPLPKRLQLSVEEVQKASDFLIKKVQEESYPEELALLKSGKTWREFPKSSRLHKVSVYLDENGILRAQGRLENAELPYQVKHPAILDKKHRITQLLVSHYHERCGHHGHERIANEVRQLYHIPSLRQAVRAAANHCRDCAHRRVQPNVPEMGQLPFSRVQAGRPFQNTGVDYFGPIEVIVKRSREKRYVALFTCLATRAIHLELAGSLSTDSFLMALRRFVSRRNCPADLFSDNGTNFIGANRELKETLAEFNQMKIEAQCTANGIRWHFNPPSAPHMGGSWERMVRSTKIALGDTLSIQNLREEVLLTLLCEAEHTVNAHPLTHVPDDPDDPEALTPNHFLIGASSNLQQLGHAPDASMLSRKQWKVVQQMADHFWKRWVKEFLPTLLRKEKWCQPARPIQVGDIVVEVDESLPRNTWIKARVVQLYPGKDAKVRVVDIRRGNGKVYKRPVSKLCVLDVHVS